MINFTNDEINFMKKAGIDFTQDYSDLEDDISNYLMMNCISGNSDITGDGIICESILDKIGNT